MHDKQEIRNNRIAHIYRLLDATTKSMEKIKEMLRNLDKDDNRQSYHDVEGLTGVYDGAFMVAADGEKHDVPVNYAAKSRLVVGDSLKMVDEDGKKVFKQIEKVDRKKVEGILTKKEGKWHIISDSGTYKVSDIAADFQHAELNDEAVAFVPAQNLNVQFAALDIVKKKKQPTPEVSHSAPVEQRKPEVKPAPAAVKPAPARPAPVPTQAPRPATSQSSNRPRPSSSNSRPASSGTKPRSSSYSKPPVRKEYVEDIVRPAPTPTAAPTPSVNLDDDDLR